MSFFTQKKTCIKTVKFKKKGKKNLKEKREKLFIWFHIISKLLKLITTNLIETLQSNNQIAI